MKTIPGYSETPSTRKKVTIVDVAKAAKVSVATVSRVINGHPSVSPKTRSLVREAMADMDYAPAAPARDLRAGFSGVVCLAVVDVAPFMSEIVQGVSDAVEPHGYQLLLASTRGQLDREEQALCLLSERRVDGLILTYPHLDEDVLRQVLRRLKRIVLIGDTHPSLMVDSIAVANREAAYRATMHLLDHGHRHIGFVAGWPNEPDGELRLAGFRDALLERNIPWDDSLVERGDFTVAGGAHALQSWLAKGRLPTAILAANDLSAFGVLRAAREAGLSIPEDLAVMGFDDVPQSEYVFPTLSTVHQPAHEMGAAAGRALVEILADVRGSRQRVILPAPLVLRQSCGCHKGGTESSARSREASFQEHRIPSRGESQ